MKQLIPIDEYGVFADMKDTARVDSRFVAQIFEKNHRDVLRNIHGILEEDSGYSQDFTERNFALSSNL